MRIHKEKDMVKGWFVGNFEPTTMKTYTCEAAIKRYKSGDGEAAHMHKIAIEITFVVEGKIKMNNNIYEKGDIITMDPGEYTDFSALEDSIISVIKVPCVIGDKYALHSA